MGDYYDRDGRPMFMLDWARSFEDMERKIVGKDKVGEVLVSTVWLGLDHAFGSGPPLIFETMVFGGVLDGEQDRYTTEAEAVTGHAEMLLRVQQGEGEHDDG